MPANPRLRRGEGGGERNGARRVFEGGAQLGCRTSRRIRSERFRALMVYKAALEEVVWMGQSAKRIIDILGVWDAHDYVFSAESSREATKMA
jgi:hypothetical protein